MVDQAFVQSLRGAQAKPKQGLEPLDSSSLFGFPEVKLLQIRIYAK